MKPILASVLLLAYATIAQGASPPAAPAPSARDKDAAKADDISGPARGAAAPKASDTSNDSKLLWDHWYTISVGSGPKPMRYAYHNTRVELVKGRVALRNHVWKDEEGHLNEEQIGVFAQADDDLTPLFFNFHSNYRATETTIDGNVKDGRELTVRAQRGQVELPVVRKSIPKRAFFSELFPVWLGQRMAGFKRGQTQSFQTLLEDSFDAGFPITSGLVRLESPDELATRTGGSRFSVDFGSNKSTWWVEPSGAMIRMEIPLQKIVIERVTKEKAQAFLKVK